MGYDDHGRDWGMNDGMGWGGWLMMSAVLILCLVVVVALIYLLVRGTGPNAAPGSAGGPAHQPRSTALLMLDERFARGEIDQDEYEQRKRALQAG